VLAAWPDQVTEVARSGLMNTLRRFYRLTQQRKIKAIRHL
jgi:hypothetical protein